jgi:hypothetical protein
MQPAPGREEHISAQAFAAHHQFLLQDFYPQHSFATQP